jgi:hypothetical protein
MPYRNIISFRVGDQMRADLEALAGSRDTDIGKLLRALVRRELSGERISPAEQREQILFLAIAMDGLLGAHVDPTLRTTVIDLWRERLIEEGRRHAE